MLRRALARAAVLALPASLLTVLVLACADSSPSPRTTDQAGDPPPAADADVCHAEAAARARCGDRLGPEEERACRRDLRPLLSVARPDFVAAVAACTRELDCETLLRGGGAAVCLGKLEGSLSPTASAREFCERSIDKGRSCRQAMVMTETMCLRRYQIYRDDLLAAGSDCARLACPAWDACLKRSVAVARPEPPAFP